MYMLLLLLFAVIVAGIYSTGTHRRWMLLSQFPVDMFVLMASLDEIFVMAS